MTCISCARTEHGGAPEGDGQRRTVCLPRSRNQKGNERGGAGGARPTHTRSSGDCLKILEKAWRARNVMEERLANA